ncbi:unnamed protein product, partial [Oikopleura dioica]
AIYSNFKSPRNAHSNVHFPA